MRKAGYLAIASLVLLIPALPLDATQADQATMAIAGGAAASAVPGGDVGEAAPGADGGAVAAPALGTFR